MRKNITVFRQDLFVIMLFQMFMSLNQSCYHLVTSLMRPNVVPTSLISSARNRLMKQDTRPAQASQH